MRLNLMRVLCERLSQNLPARDIRHDGRQYLRRYYLCTVFGVRCYLHHFVDSDPVGLHNHPWKFGGSIVLSGFYFEERRFCAGAEARRIRFFNIVNGDTLHRVIVPSELKSVGVWTLFWHTRKAMNWGTLKNKGAFIQYFEETATFPQENGHSTWYKTAPKGKELFPLL